MEKPFKMMTQALMGNLRDCSDVDNSIKVPQTHLLPSEARQILPNWSPNEGRAARFGKYYSSKSNNCRICGKDHFVHTKLGIL